jgi:hypothetical protein
MHYVQYLIIESHYICTPSHPILLYSSLPFLVSPIIVTVCVIYSPISLIYFNFNSIAFADNGSFPCFLHCVADVSDQDEIRTNSERSQEILIESYINNIKALRA